LTLARFTALIPTLDTGALVDLVTPETPARQARLARVVQHACKTGRLVVSATDQRVLADFFGGAPRDYTRRTRHRRTPEEREERLVALELVRLATLVPLVLPPATPLRARMASIFAALRANPDATEATCRRILHAKRCFPSVRNSNKMLMGGVILRYLVNLLTSVGVDATDVSQQNLSARLQLPEGALAVHSMTGLTGNVILANYRKDQGDHLLDPFQATLFLVETGPRTVKVCFADEDIIQATAGLTGNRQIYGQSAANLSLRNKFFQDLLLHLPAEYSVSVRLGTPLPPCVELDATNAILRLNDAVLAAKE
jgi:hypothetical protein